MSDERETAEHLRRYAEIPDRANIVQELVETGLFTLERSEQIAECLLESADEALEESC